MKFKHFRILILLLVLSYFVADAMLSDEMVSDWTIPLKIVVYPINADNSSAAGNHIEALSLEDLVEIDRVLTREGKRYDMDLKYSIDIDLSEAIDNAPPQPPIDNNVAQVIMWSIMLRYWAWKNDNYTGDRPDIRVFVLFFDPVTSPSLGHSTGLEKGHMALVNAFGSKEMEEQNNFVIMHEVLHTLGATDKYDFANNQPIYPEGFAEPERDPLYPQRFAEIMGGRIPQTTNSSIMPTQLKYAVIGPVTAKEIGWVK